MDDWKELLVRIDGDKEFEIGEREIWEGIEDERFEFVEFDK